MRVRISYHRVSDDSVSGSEWEVGDESSLHIIGLLTATDIDSVWVRRCGPLDHTNPAVYIKGAGE